MDRLYLELERFKAERGWHNLSIARASIPALLTDTSWYQLLIPESELAFDSFAKVSVWQELALVLLRKSTERYYTFRKQEWELPRLEYQDLTEDDPNFPTTPSEDGMQYGYRILIKQSQQDFIRELERLKESIINGIPSDLEYRGLKAVMFRRHLYVPLLHLNSDVAEIEVSPVPLNKGEFQFVRDLEAFHHNNHNYFMKRELYLIRNLSKGHGIGFFEAGNFHPDFIIWLLEGERQRVTFVNPKGIRFVGLNDPKINFYLTIKEIEERLKQPNIVLESFIISNTRRV